MAELKRPSAELDGRSGGITEGIYLARVISHLDTSFMGSLEVVLLKDQANAVGEETQTFVVRYASPFFGYTPFESMGFNDGTKSTLDGYNDTQKSYGMWFVPPDIGVNVLVLFVNNDPAQGYWFACVPGRNINNMVPAIAASPVNACDPQDKAKYGPMKDDKGNPLPLPVAEINKRINGDKQEIDPEKFPRVVHPIADRFLEQGTLEDDVRGPCTSSPRREAPSMVFGISSPGPVDRRPGAKVQKIGKLDSQATVPVGRLGGTQIVMDDGDDRYHREKPASEGPIKYIDLLDKASQNKGETGQPTIPYGEYFRVRTRTGHQLLMHNSEDLIYIANARGTTWIELSSNGKIDIFAQDSISIHTENDLNIRADRDINLEAGRNINMRTESGRWRAEIATDLEFLVNNDAKITIGANYNLLVGDTTKISTFKDFNISTNGDNNLTAGGDTSIGSKGAHKETAASINMNNNLNADPAEVAEFVKPLDLRDNPLTSVSSGWDKKYQGGTISSIMKRIPMHEPWALHEHFAPDVVNSKETDREN